MSNDTLSVEEVRSMLGVMSYRLYEMEVALANAAQPAFTWTDFLELIPRAQLILPFHTKEAIAEIVEDAKGDAVRAFLNEFDRVVEMLGEDYHIEPDELPDEKEVEMSTPEGRVKAAVIKRLKARGAYYTAATNTVRSRGGIPDILVCHVGRFIGLEIKAPGKAGNLTELQKHELSQVEKAGGRAHVIDNADQIDHLLDAIEMVVARE